VFEFTIGKRGSKSGWKPDGEGYYIRYFAHSLAGPMHWLPATEAEIAAAQQDSGLSDEDLFDLFSTNHPDLSREAIRTGLERAGFEVTEEQLDNMLDRLQGEDKLIATEIDGKTVFRTAKSARRAEKKIDIREAVFEIVLNAGGAGILTTEIRDRVPFGSGEVGTALAELLNLGRIRFEKEGSRGKRYFASLSPVVFVADQKFSLRVWLGRRR
jgi:hypothetical protein